jgi:hypothetical protein
VFVPIFGSCPTHLNERQDKILRTIWRELNGVGLEWRSLGRTDYPNEFPLREVLTMARHCAGGLILGFSQFVTDKGTWKKGTPFAKEQKGPVSFPTPWNQLEAGILFSLRVPLLVFREKNLSGGIFDLGVTELYIHEMPPWKPSKKERMRMREVFRKWAANVHDNYYGRK